MRKGLSLLFLSGALFTALAAGYRIPEQSLRSTATAAAYGAWPESPDALFYNPAALSWLKDGWLFEGGARYILLPRITYEGLVYDPVLKTYVYARVKSSKEEFIAPYFFLATPKVGKLRFGLSFTTPAGLAKKWGSYPASAYAREFTLKVFELSASFSYELTRYLSVGGGLRGVYAEGRAGASYPGVYSITMDGNTDVRPGWHLSVALKPTESLRFSALYRSKVPLKLSGYGWGYAVLPTALGPVNYPIKTGGSVRVPLPAELRLSAAWRWRSTTFEFSFERVYWSSYEQLDFDYDDPTAEALFGSPRPKNWEDVNAYRFGVRHTINKLELNAGVAYTESPIPTSSLGFELPEPKYAWVLSGGLAYKPSPNAELGLGYLYLVSGSRKVTNALLRGEFTDVSAHILTLSLGLRF
ncbi:MAG: transporter [Aquificae bacterium]|nr:transporter [Aquificota bacterium]